MGCLCSCCPFLGNKDSEKETVDPGEVDTSVPKNKSKKKPSEDSKEDDLEKNSKNKKHHEQSPRRLSSKWKGCNKGEPKVSPRGTEGRSQTKTNHTKHIGQEPRKRKLKETLDWGMGKSQKRSKSLEEPSLVCNEVPISPQMINIMPRDEESNSSSARSKERDSNVEEQKQGKGMEVDASEERAEPSCSCTNGNQGSLEMSAFNSNQTYRSSASNNLGTGLPNLGTTCYMNSTLQALSPLSELIPFLETLESELGCGEGKQSQEFDVLDHFCRVMEHLRDSSFKKSDECLTSLYFELNKEGFNDGEQDDSHRFFNHIFDKINDFIQSFPEVQIGEVPFKVRITDVTTCKAEGCGHLEEANQFAYCLTVPVPSETLEQNLEEYFRPVEYEQMCVKCSLKQTLKIANEKSDSLKDMEEQNDDVLKSQIELLKKLLADTFDAKKALRKHKEFVQNHKDSETCVPYCRVKTTHSDTPVIKDLPQSLCLHLNRSSMKVGNNIIKDQKHISFPQTFNSQDLFKDSTTDSTYFLKSVIVHFGSSCGGHYIAHRLRTCKAGETQWVSASDEEVTDIEIEGVMKSKAYMLFYERE